MTAARYARRAERYSSATTLREEDSDLDARERSMIRKERRLRAWDEGMPRRFCEACGWRRTKSYCIWCHAMSEAV